MEELGARLRCSVVGFRSFVFLEDSRFESFSGFRRSAEFFLQGIASG